MGGHPHRAPGNRHRVVVRPHGGPGPYPAANQSHNGGQPGDPCRGGLLPVRGGRLHRVRRGDHGGHALGPGAHADLLLVLAGLRGRGIGQIDGHVAFHASIHGDGRGLLTPGGRGCGNIHRRFFHGLLHRSPGDLHPFLRQEKGQGKLRGLGPPRVLDR